MEYASSNYGEKTGPIKSKLRAITESSVKNKLIIQYELQPITPYANPFSGMRTLITDKQVLKEVWRAMQTTYEKAVIVITIIHNNNNYFRAKSDGALFVQINFLRVTPTSG